MKRIKNIAGPLFLATIYCFAIFHFSNSNEFQFLINSNDTLSSKKKQIDFVSASQTGIDFSINQLTKETSNTKNNASNSLLYALNFYPEIVISSALKQYTNRSKTRQVNYRKNDSIFPFHYHW